MVNLGGHDLPSALRRVTTWERIGPSGIPVMLVRPKASHDEPVPVVIWMHGRTVNKELDPGRYLRLMRAGIAVCAADLPGHGERFDAALQEPVRTYDVVMQMIDEIDELVDTLAAKPEFDASRMGIGGMSAGGMATLARLCHEHPFRCASVEGTTGSWMQQRRRTMFRHRSVAEIAEANPLDQLDTWREIPLQALHARHDEWVGLDGQQTFIDALRERYANPELIDFVIYDRTGAPYEHAGFGRHAADAKSRQTAFFRRNLIDEH